jgi:hypothetical protein
METYSLFDKSRHLQPQFDRDKFESLHGWNLGWELLSQINVATDQDDSEIRLSMRLSPGQKALYFIWYLDAQVTNGGFIQFYWNGYRKYLSPIIEGLNLIGDNEMLNLVQKADKEFLTHRNKFEIQQEADDWKPLYESLTVFDEYDNIYYSRHDTTMSLIESYVRSHAEEFVRFN